MAPVPNYETDLPTTTNGTYDRISALKMNGVNTNGHHTNGRATQPATVPTECNVLPSRTATLLSVFLDTLAKLEARRAGEPVRLNGQSLSIPDVVAAGRYNVPVSLDDNPAIRAKIEKSELAMEEKLASGKSVYGVSTGYGGSADTRTHDHLSLGKSLLQHQHTGVLPSDNTSPSALPLLDPISSLSMPESWVRAAILIRINSLIRGHSGVQWSLMEAMTRLLNENIVPVVPLRGSISASGDLSPLSYVAGTLIGNPGIRVFDGPAKFGTREIVSAPAALAAHGMQPHNFHAKEHLGLLNGTAFSAAVASLALNDAIHLALLTQVCTALGTEALGGCQASHHPFIHNVTRPHPGQVEAAKNMWDLLEGSSLAIQGEEKELTIEEDTGKLRQDRYPLRTSPQFIGPQLEDMLSAFISVTQECNSTTDNPLIDGTTGAVHHGGNFQAMAVTNAMEKTRLSLHHLGKLLFAQSTELLNPHMNHGLPPNLAGSDPSINYHCKGLDIATASYVSELGFLANPVSTHIQSAEMHNQAVNSLALISARQTIAALDVLTCLVASYLYILCQGVDLRAQQAMFEDRLGALLAEGLETHFGSYLAPNEQRTLLALLFPVVLKSLEETSTMDASARFPTVLASTTTPLVDYFLSRPSPSTTEALSSIPAFRASVASHATTYHTSLQHAFVSGEYGPAPAAAYLGRTRPVYEYIRITLGVRHHGEDNFAQFRDGYVETTIGQNVSKIYEAIRDGKMQRVVAGLFTSQQ